MKMAEIMLEVEGKTQPWKVVVMKGMGGEALLGVDHPVTLSLFGKSLSTMNGDDPVLGVDQEKVLPIMSDNSGGMCAITRAKSQAQVDEIAQHEAANAKKGAVPIPLTLPTSAASPRRSQRKCKFGLTSTMPTTDLCEVNVESDDEVEVTASPSVSSQEGEGTHSKDVVEKKEDLESSLVEAGGIVGLEKLEPNGEPLLPDLSHDRDGIGELIAQQQNDGTLSEMRKRAKSEEQGFYFNGGVLMHSKLMEQGREVSRVVVPLTKRSEVMSAGHKGLVGGHFSHNKMASHLKQSFTWLGLERDVREFCATCPECQKAGRPLLPRVPMIETPIISVLYHHMAFDIVGPLKRTKWGYCHILTAMCMGTHYPYCVPLKRVDAISVADGLMEILSHTGIPVELVTDQGAVFVGKVCNELYRLLNIKHIMVAIRVCYGNWRED